MTTRFDDSANETEAAKAQQRVGILCSLDFSSGFVRATNRAHDVPFSGDTYQGIGQLGSIDTVHEDAELRPYALKISISGVDNALLSKALTEDYHGRTVLLYVGWFRDDDTLVANPQRVFKGFMDYMAVTLGDRTGVISIVCENEWARWSTPKPLLYAHETQQVYYPGDLIFNQVPYLKNKTVRWGGSRVSIPTPSPPGRDPYGPGRGPLP